MVLLSPTPRTFVHNLLAETTPALCWDPHLSWGGGAGIAFPQGILHPPLGILSHFPLSLHIFSELAVWALGHGLWLGILPYISRNIQSQFSPSPQPQACLCSFSQVTIGNFRYSKCPSNPSYPSFLSGTLICSAFFQVPQNLPKLLKQTEIWRVVFWEVELDSWAERSFRNAVEKLDSLCLSWAQNGCLSPASKL